MTGLLLIVLQILLPLALIAWLAFAPPRQRLIFCVQVLATGLVLVALLLVAAWLIPPWWTPYVYLALWALAVLVRCPRVLRSTDAPPASRKTWATLLLHGGLAVWATTMILQALDARNLPAGAVVVDLPLPLGPGEFLVANGGSSALLNAHILTLQPKTDRQRAYRGQSYAVDLIKLGEWGLRAPGWRPTDPAAYEIFGVPVYAPCPGTVLAAADDKPDMPVPDTDTSRLEGNYVAIQCGEMIVLLAHLEQGSVEVEAGDRVALGAPLGRAGNSGQTHEPHLHMHVQGMPGDGPLLSGEPFFLTLNGAFPVRNQRIVADGMNAH